MSFLYNTKIVLFGNGKLEVTLYGQQRAKIESTDSQNNNVRENIECTESFLEEFSEDIDELKKQQEEDVVRQLHRLKRKLRYDIKANDFNLFWTLTFNPKLVNAFDYQEVRKLLQNWLKYQREKFGRFSYIFIPELHKSGQIHWHGVTGGFYPNLVEGRSSKSQRLIKKNGKQIYNASDWKYGFSTVSEIEATDKTSSYITKYITKDIIKIPREPRQSRYLISRGLNKPEISYEFFDKGMFDDFTPYFIAGTIDLEKGNLLKDISMYDLKLDIDGNLYQDIQVQPIIKTKIRNPRGNEGFSKDL